MKGSGCYSLRTYRLFFTINGKIPFEKRDEMNTNIDYLAAKYIGSLKIGYVDCTKEKALCDKYQVHYFPTIKYVMSNYVHDFFGRTSLRSLIEMCDSLNSSSFISLLTRSGVDYDDIG